MNDARPVRAATVVGRRRRRWRLPVALGLAVLAAGGVWLGALRPWEARPASVATERAEAGPVRRVLAVNGRIAPQAQVSVQATVPGRVATVLVREGDRVEAGAVLATLDDAQQASAVSQASAALEGSIAQVQAAKASFERAKSLGDAISRKDYEAARVALQTAQNDVERLSAARNQAESLLGQYTIRAPFTGTVLTRGVDPGQVVSASTVLFAFADLEHVRAEASVDELYSAQFRRGLAARLEPSGYNRILAGTVSFVSPTVDPATGGRAVRVDIEDTMGLVLPIGLTVNLNIVVAEAARAITVPRAAILDPRGAPAVLVVKDGMAVRRPVEFIDWPAARLIVTSGLAEGDRVITDAGKVPAGSAVAPMAE